MAGMDAKDRHNEPPDIGVDFEHQRREEVIQYICNKYGRLRATLTAVVISYRPRSVRCGLRQTLGGLRESPVLSRSFLMSLFFEVCREKSALASLLRGLGCSVTGTDYTADRRSGKRRFSLVSRHAPIHHRTQQNKKFSADAIRGFSVKYAVKFQGIASSCTE